MGEGDTKKRKGSSPLPNIANGDDRISKLPDSLIHHIFSFLEMGHVIKTSVLSKRWRYLWTSTPVLDFRNLKDNDSRISRFICLSLLRYDAVKIRKFNAHLHQSVDPCHIDSWFYFTTKRHVEELDIQLFCKDRYGCSYTMPRGLLDSGSLRVLKLRNFDLTHPGSFSFQWLTELHLSFVKLTYLSTSVCPCLEILIIEGCDNDLEIHASNQKLRYLKLVDNMDLEHRNFMVYAPFLLSVEFSGCLGWIYNFRDISSVTCATLNFYDMHENIDYAEENLAELLANLSHVKPLKLCQCCMEVLACRETCRRETPNLRAIRLEVTTNLQRWEVPGFTSLLMSSQYLEFLIVNISNHSSSLDFKGFFNEEYYRNSNFNEFWDAALSVASKLQNLTIHDFLGSDPIRLFSQPSPLSYILEKWEEIVLVRQLLKGCKILKKLNIITTKSSFLSLRSKLLQSLKKELQGFPRV